MTHANWLIRNGRVIDPANNHDGVTDIAIRDGRVAAVGVDASSFGGQEFNATDMVVGPGLIDMHVHLRVPGFEYKETVATGTSAAVAGGFTAVACMPNTRPALDSVEVLEQLAATVAREGLCRVFPIAAISVGRRGEEAVDYDALAAAGAIGFSDDGDSTMNSAIMVAALESTKRHGRPVMVHCEDRGLVGGSIHEGDVSRRLGLKGLAAEAEEIIIARDILLAQMTGGWLHVLHVTTGRGIDLITQSRSWGANVTAEVMPHHLVMSDEWVAGSRSLLNVSEPAGEPGRSADPNTKVNPPLRPAADTVALLDALKAGRFDIVATDHAPHAAHEKAEADFLKAAFGMSGSELALPTMLALVRAGHLTMADVIRLLSTAPGTLFSTGGGTLTVGAPADVVVFDPNRRWTVTPSELKTKSANTPLLGMQLQGRAVLTLVDGEERFHA